MRRFFPLLIFLSFCFFLGAGVASAERTLVVYYSRDGHTKLVAEKLAEKFGGDIERLIDKKKRTGPIGTLTAGKDAIAGNLTTLEPLKHDPRTYDLILIGTPSWFGNVTPAVRTFIMQHDLTGKRVALFGTAHLTGVENALKQAAELIAHDNPEPVPTLPLRHRDLQDDPLSEKIDAFHRQVTGVVSASR